MDETKRTFPYRSAYAPARRTVVSPMRRLTYFESLRLVLAREGRRYFSEWRALSIWDQTMVERGLDGVRWERLPTAVEARTHLRRLASVGQIVELEGVRDVYEIAQHGDEPRPVSVSEVLGELHPSAVRIYASAAEVLGLSNRFSQVAHYAYVKGSDGGYDSGPLATLSEPRRRPAQLFGTAIHWHGESEERVSWHELRHLPSGGPAVRVATIERCLVDALHQPQHFGGWSEVLKIWESGTYYADVDALVRYTDVIDSGVLRQRVGFMAEAFDLTHPTFDAWASNATPGGNRVLVAGQPWSGSRDERWKLGINGEIQAKEE